MTTEQRRSSDKAARQNKAKVKLHEQRLSKDARIESVLEAVYHGEPEKLRSILFTSSWLVKDDKTKSPLDLFSDVSVLPLVCTEGAVSALGRGKVTDISSWIECLRLLSTADISMDTQDRNGRTALHIAVLHKNYELADELLGLLVRYDHTDKDGYNCLHQAVNLGDTQMVELLLQKLSVQVLDTTDKFGRTPLCLGLMNGSSALFECLLSGGLDPNCVMPDGRPIIFHAVEKNLTIHVKQLVEHGVNLETVNGFSAIHFAACQENPENIDTFSTMVSENFLSAGDKEGKTPLMYAALMGLDQNLKLLLKAKIGILQQDNEGKTALHYTATNTHKGCVDRLCNYDSSILTVVDLNGNSSGHDAIMAQNTTVLKAMIDNGLDINSTDNEKHTLIHWATVYDSYEALELLIKVGAEVNVQDQTGAYPLHYACQLEEDTVMRESMNHILQLLLANGALIEATDNNGRRPIHWAGSSGNKDGLEILARKGATIDVGTQFEKLTALHLAASQGYVDCVKFLVENASASVNLADATGSTPIFYACAAGDADSVELLLKAGSNPNAISADGKRPLHCAASQNVLKCLVLLVEGEALLSPQSSQGDTPLHEAASNGQADCVRYLLAQGCTPDIKNMVGATALHYAVAENHHTVTEHLLKGGANVNAIFPTGPEGNYVSALDIALGNGDYACVKLLQANEGRTGHSIVQNAATVIQHRWKSYRDRKLKTEGDDGMKNSGSRSRRSTLSESVSVRDEREFRSTEEGAWKSAFEIKIQERLGSLDISPGSPTNVSEEASWPLRDRLARSNALGEKSRCKIDKAKLEDIMYQRAQGRKAMEEMKKFLSYAESLRADFDRVSKEAKDIVDSEEFLAVKAYNQRMKGIKRDCTKHQDRNHEA